MANNIQEAPWKISFSTVGNGPYAVRMKLLDLLFNTEDHEEGGEWVPRTAGIKLPHDILIFDPNIYETSDGGSLLSGTAYVEGRRSRGFYLTKVSYDARARANAVTYPATPISEVPIWVPSNEVGGVYDYPANPEHPDYATHPENTHGYYIYPSNAVLTIDVSDYRAANLRTYIASGTDAPTEHEDPEDSGTPLVTYQTSCTVAISGTSAEEGAFLILSSPDYALASTIPGSSLIPYTKVRFQASPAIPEVVDVIRFFTSYGLDDDGTPLEGYTTTDLLDPAVNTRLQTEEVWIRCGYFADYVVPDTFMQDLTATSEVSHKNIVVGVGDFVRHSRDAEVSEIHPYLPSTPPRLDLLEVSDSDAVPFPIPSRTGTYVVPETGHRAPLGWYDPDFPDENNSSSVLVALPEEGNIYTSGRVFSPTIDELWTYIKRLVDGRDNDQTAAATPGPRSTYTGEFGIVVDTRLPTEPALDLGSKTGDPISADGTSFVNAPEGIRYVVNANIKYLTDKIGITVSDYYPFTTHSDADVLISSRTRVNPTNLQTSGDWGPRANPMSLRELEAEIKNVQFTTETLFNFIAANKVSTGNTDTDEVNTHGSLYQLHRSFDPILDVEDPNSKWITYANTAFNTETADTYGSVLTPSTNYNYQQDIQREDVYLSAEGQWRYLFDHVRVPVLDETY